jgi:proline iminopeptidase
VSGRRALAASLLAALAAAGCGGRAPVGAPALWPAAEPFATGTLRVSERHEIHYSLAGNPEGFPVFVLHGGPGAGSDPFYGRFFDPGRFLVVQHDQRGCGRSRPLLELRENTTAHLVADIEALRESLGVERMLLFGGSWGATLALAYGEAHPERVAAMILRGPFLATQAEVDHLYHGGAAAFFPDDYARLRAALPDPDAQPLPDSLVVWLTERGAETRRRVARAWARWEFNLAKLDSPRERMERIIQDEASLDDLVAIAGLEAWYTAHGCFLAEGQLLRDAPRLAGVPVTIVVGRYDMVCPPANAWRLHEALPGSRLVIAEGAGHSITEEPVLRALLTAVSDFAP